MKNKIKLEKIRLESFVTSLNNKEENTILGAQNVDTSKIQHCTPHGSIQTCPASAFPCGSVDKLTVVTVDNTIWSFCRCIF